MRADPRDVLSHPTVLALDEEVRTVLLALIREASQWGEIPTKRAAAVVARTLQSIECARTTRDVLAVLHRVRLVHRDEDTNDLIVWTPRQRDDADVFLAAERDRAPIDRDESEAL